MYLSFMARQVVFLGVYSYFALLFAKIFKQ